MHFTPKLPSEYKHLAKMSVAN